MSKNYFIVENNTVVNLIVWDGNKNSWSPKDGSLVLQKETTPSKNYEFDNELNKFVLVEHIGQGDIGYTFDGTYLVDNNDPNLTANSTE